IIMAALMGSLALVSILLLVLAPAPLERRTPSLLAAESLEGMFSTDTPVENGRWTSIFVHHSKTTNSGLEANQGANQGGQRDHFVIGNGNGTADGEIVLCNPWLAQRQATPAGVALPSGCISICL